MNTYEGTADIHALVLGALGLTKSSEESQVELSQASLPSNESWEAFEKGPERASKRRSVGSMALSLPITPGVQSESSLAWKFTPPGAPAAHCARPGGVSGAQRRLEVAV